MIENDKLNSDRTAVATPNPNSPNTTSPVAIKVNLLLAALYKRRLVLVVISLLGIALFISTMYYWVALTFATNSYSLRPTGDTSLAQATWIVCKDIFLLILAYYAIKIAWMGFSSLHNLFQSQAVALLIADRLSDANLTDRQRVLLFNKLVMTLSQNILTPTPNQLDGITDTLRLFEAMVRGSKSEEKAESNKDGRSNRPRRGGKQQVPSPQPRKPQRDPKAERRNDTNNTDNTDN